MKAKTLVYCKVVNILDGLSIGLNETNIRTYANFNYCLELPSLCRMISINN